MPTIEIPKPGETKSVTFKAGEPLALKFDLPVTYVIKTKDGMTIQGELQPESVLHVTPSESLLEFSCYLCSSNQE